MLMKRRRKRKREKIQLHPPEHQHRLPKPRNLDKPPVQPHTQWENTTTKKNKQGRENYKENTGTKLITNTKKQKLKI